MSRNIMTITKWVPLENEENKTFFLECRRLRKSSTILLNHLGKFLGEFELKNLWKTYHLSDNSELVQKLSYTSETIASFINSFNNIFEKLTVKDSNGLYVNKLKFWKGILWNEKMKLQFFLQQLLNKIAYLYVYCGESILLFTLRISVTYNELLSMDSKYGKSDPTSICSNTCPYLHYQFRKMSITKLLQILAQNRAELCCHKLIDCLLETYKFYEIHDEDKSSDNSSIEIYKAITKHLSPPVDLTEGVKVEEPDKLNVDDSCSFSNMEELISYEEQNVIELLNAAIEVAPAMLGYDTVRKTKDGDTKISTKAKNKVLSYYQEILWGEAGNFLEHVILWWGASPMAARSPHSSQHLREWITQYTPTADVPTYILSALANLADALGVHVTSTSWDCHFQQASVASKAQYSSDTGKLFCQMLQDLVTLSNQCETTSDWIVGAPLDELPLVEQIPILHRLDHSIHTTRLWAINEIKKLANNWSVESFFLITHCDVVNCLVQIADLKLTDHAPDLEKPNLRVHVKVCGSMRAKLVSEVKTNIEKLKETQRYSLKCLASVCRTVSLANLQLIFPSMNYWKQIGDQLPKTPSKYVSTYLDEILNPVLAATDDHSISNMVLKIMCESWLDHIYLNKFRFSQYGAYQLLTDFASVDTWLVNCPIVTQHMRKMMLKNEVLRRCEGVGRLLLRLPGEHIKMNDKKKKYREDDESSNSDSTELMPPEMYVPNQEQWLELRASKQKNLFFLSLCCGNSR